MNETLKLQHPDDLTIPDSDSSVLDMMNPPRMFSASDPGQTTYMPPPTFIHMIQRPRFQKLADGECRFIATMSAEVNYILMRLIHLYHPGAVVSTQGARLILCCKPQGSARRYAEFIRDTVPKAVNDYWTEHAVLLRLAYENMWKNKQRNYWLAQMQAELANFQQQSREAMTFAEGGCPSASFPIWWKLPVHYRSILEVKFGYWSRVLDAATISKYRAAFAFVPLPC